MLLQKRYAASDPMKAAIIIGHTPASPGATSRRGYVTEWNYNSFLAPLIEDRAASDCIIVERGLPNDYDGLPAKVNATGADFAIELHANAFNGEASGTEMLYWHSSTKGKQLAEILQTEILRALGLRHRGIKPCRRADRGGYLLQKTRMPCVIAEPFFIDHDGDLEAATRGMCRLAEAYASAIDHYASE